MTPKIPCLILGDAPTQPSGLARVARDLAQVASEHPDLEVHFLGWEPASGSWAGWNGDYPLWRFSDQSGWGRPLLDHVRAVLLAQGRAGGIIWPIWDAQRAFEILDAKGSAAPGYHVWSYPAIDAVDVLGSLRGPARFAIQRADHVAAYSQWAAEIMIPLRHGPVEVIPHPVGEAWFTPAIPYPAGHLRLGCVATNQPRKDLALFVRVIAELKARGEPVLGWLHTDQLRSPAWNVPDLLRQYRVADHIEVTVSGPSTTDPWLRGQYDRCHGTLAVGRGEGFGYPIVESMARGRWVVHCDYGGGAEMIPEEWRVTADTWDVEGLYSLRRPRLAATVVADRVQAILWQHDRQTRARQAAEAYRATTVVPRWRRWIHDGVEKWKAEYGQ